MKQAHHHMFYVIIFENFGRQGNNNKWSNENNVSFIIKGPICKGIDRMDMSCFKNGPPFSNLSIRFMYKYEYILVFYQL